MYLCTYVNVLFREDIVFYSFRLNFLLLLIFGPVCEVYVLVLSVSQKLTQVRFLGESLFVDRACPQV